MPLIASLQETAFIVGRGRYSGDGLQDSILLTNWNRCLGTRSVRSTSGLGSRPSDSKSTIKASSMESLSVQLDTHANKTPTFGIMRHCSLRKDRRKGASVRFSILSLERVVADVRLQRTALAYSYSSALTYVSLSGTAWMNRAPTCSSLTPASRSSSRLNTGLGKLHLLSITRDRKSDQNMVIAGQRFSK